MKGPTTPISNRGNFTLPPDGKVHVVPLGEYPVQHCGKTIVQVVDNRACQAMLTNLQKEASRQNFGGLCMDFDHFRHDPEKESRAAGWVFNAEARADGLYTAPRWTASGTAAIEGGDYRFISPEFDADCLEHLYGDRYRVTKLVGFGLTNAPNMRGMVALTNRLSGMGIAPLDTGGRRVEIKPDGRLGRVVVEGPNGRLTFARTGQPSPEPVANREPEKEEDGGTTRAKLISAVAKELGELGSDASLTERYRRAAEIVDAEQLHDSGELQQIWKRAHELKGKFGLGPGAALARARSEVKLGTV